MDKIDLSIIMPALNEEENILKAIDDTLDSFKKYKIKGEIVVVNDGSTDRTEELVRKIIVKENLIRLINHNKTMGIGTSFWDGVDNAAGDFVCMIPGDNENYPGEIMRYYRMLEHVDIVIPFVFNKGRRSLFRNALSFLYRFIINSTFVVYFNYTNGTVLYRKSILTEIDYRSTGFFFQTDVLIRSVYKGYLFAEVPYRLGLRRCGSSNAVTFPTLMQVVRGYLRLVKDIYFSEKSKVKEKFNKDSLTALRRGTFGND